MPVLLIGDPHFDSQTPISRIDDYRETTLKKLYSLLSLALSHKAKTVITAGDFFHKYQVPISYLNEVIEVLKKFKDNDIDFYSLIGNHDLPHDKMVYFNSTPLSLLFKSGLVKHLRNETLGNTEFFGLDFTEIDRADELNEKAFDSNKKYKFLVMHYATDNTIANESISRASLNNFTAVLSGHDHMPYGRDGAMPIMLRPGSFMRRTKDEYNLERTDVIVYKYDEMTSEITELSLPGVEAPNVIFSEHAFSSSTRELLETMSAHFSSEFFSKKSQNIFEILDNLAESVDKDILSRIEKELTKSGLSRQNQWQ